MLPLSNAEGDVTFGSGAWPVYQLFGLWLASDFAFANRLVLSQAKELTPISRSPDLTFTCIPESPLHVDWESTQPMYSSPYRTVDGESIVHVYRFDALDVLRFTHIADFYLWPDRIVCHLLDPAYDYLVEIHLLGTVLSFWLERRGVPALHASAAVIDDRAIAFLSSNSGGKSALAATLMQAGYPLLTDDILAVENRDDTFVGRPGYPQMRMWPEEALHFLGYYEDLEIVHPAYAKRRVPVGEGGLGRFCAQPRPLAGIYLPERREPRTSGAAVEITPVWAPDAVIELVRHSFVAGIAAAMGWQPRRLDFFAEVVQTIPIRRLVYPSGFEHLPRVRETIVQDLSTMLHW